MRETVIKILNGVHPGVDYETATDLIDARVLDSFDVVTLVGELMDEFGVQILAEHMLPVNFNSVDAIVALIEKLEEA